MSRRETPVVTAVAHDYFTQRGGAERVAAALISHFRPDRVLTAAYNPQATFNFGRRSAVETTFIQRIGALRRDPRRAFPLLPFAWRLFEPVTDGLLLCSSSGWAHAARVKGSARKVVYCHNPARWLYQPEDFFRDHSRAVRHAMTLFAPLLRAWDRSIARTADLYIANSTVVAERIRSCYGLESIVIPPPLAIDPDGARQPVSGVPQHYFLTVGRSRAYKNTDRLVKAFRDRPDLHLVCVAPSPGQDPIPQNVTFTGRVSDAQLRALYSDAIALVSVSHEDFGLTPLEANAFGTPALVIRSGGFLDTIQEGVSGLYFQGDDPAAITRALDAFPRTWDRGRIRRHAGTYSMAAFIARLDSALGGLDEPAIRQKDAA